MKSLEIRAEIYVLSNIFDTIYERQWNQTWKNVLSWNNFFQGLYTRIINQNIMLGQIIGASKKYIVGLN